MGGGRILYNVQIQLSAAPTTLELTQVPLRR